MWPTPRNTTSTRSSTGNNPATDFTERPAGLSETCRVFFCPHPNRPARSEQRRLHGADRKAAARRVEIPHLAAAGQGPAQGVARAARRTVVPCHDERGPIDQEIVAHGVTSPAISPGEHLHLVGRGDRMRKRTRSAGEKRSSCPRKGTTATSRTSGCAARSVSTTSAAARSNPTAIPERFQIS